jgi:peptide/nickel transport system substrate-binding protein
MIRRIRWQILIAALTMLVVAVLLGELALSTPAVSQPRMGGAYLEAIPRMPEAIVPLLNDPITDPQGRSIGAMLFDGLTRLNSENLPEPALAASWQIEQNGEVYLLYLRRDVLWHDGTPFTANDAIFTIRVIQDPAFTGDPALRGLWGSVLIDKIDDYTIRFTLEGAYAPFLDALRLPIMPEHLLRDLPFREWATSDFARTPIGTGPYRLRTWTDEQLELEANPDHYNGRPFVDTLSFRVIASPNAAFSELVNDEVQAVAVSSATAPRLAQIALPTTVERTVLPLDEYVVLSFNLRRAPFNSSSFRQALAYGLDKDALLQQVYGGQVSRLDTPILPQWWAYTADALWYPFAPEQAAAMLDDQGWRVSDDGVRRKGNELLRLTLATDTEPGRVAAAREIAQQWGALGVQVELAELEPTELRERLRTHDFMLALHGWVRLGADPDCFELWHSSQAETGLNYAGLQDEQLDTALVTGRATSNLSERRAAYAAFQQRWIELAPAITLYQPNLIFVRSSAISGVGFVPRSPEQRLMFVGREDRYRNVQRWFINTTREIRGTLR